MAAISLCVWAVSNRHGNGRRARADRGFSPHCLHACPVRIRLSHQLAIAPSFRIAISHDGVRYHVLTRCPGNGGLDRTCARCQ